MGPRMKPPSRARANGALGAAPETVCPAAGLGRTHRAVSGATAADRDEHRVRRLIARLPRRLRHRVRWLRRPASRWVRIPAAILLIAGAGLSILPFFGLWMLPGGLLLLAEDVPLLQRLRNHVLEWIERRRPHWFGDRPNATKALAGSDSENARPAPRR